MNARALESLGIGRSVLHGRVDEEDLRRFLADEAQFVERLVRLGQDGRREAADALERFIDELAAPAARRTESRVA